MISACFIEYIIPGLWLKPLICFSQICLDFILVCVCVCIKVALGRDEHQFTGVPLKSDPTGRYCPLESLSQVGGFYWKRFCILLQAFMQMMRKRPIAVCTMFFFVCTMCRNLRLSETFRCAAFGLQDYSKIAFINKTNTFRSDRIFLQLPLAKANILCTRDKNQKVFCNMVTLTTLFIGQFRSCFSFFLF